MKLVIEGCDGLPLHAALNQELRFFIANRDIQFELCELIYNSAYRQGIGFQTEKGCWELPADSLQILGFQEDELVLPPFKGLPLEYQILMELFAYPTKHLFFDLPVPAELLKSDENRFELFIYFSTSNVRLESVVGDDSLAINCAPIVNLFETQPIARPVGKYCVDSPIDANSGELDFEIFDLQAVNGIDADGAILPIDPFYNVCLLYTSPSPRD